ncbi:MAG: hypothetical protein H6728_07185 [Myxococcales bacterium]|nr:hypothetical protein [Myxococcales bacterium]
MEQQGDFFTATSPEGTFVLEWHRPHPGRHLWRIYGLGALFLVIGSLVLGVVFSWGYRLDPTVRILLGFVGGTGTVGGPLYAVLGFQQLFRDEICLVVRNDGIIYLHHQETTVIPWEEMVSIEGTDRPPSLKIELESAQDLVLNEPFIDQPPSQLAKHLWGIRRKALMGLLRPPRPQQGSYLTGARGASR